MGELDKGYYANRAAEEAELAEAATNPSAKAAHLTLQRQYIEKASVGDRPSQRSETIA